MDKPKARSRLRKILGSFYFTARKKLYWHFSKLPFASRIQAEELPYVIFTHQSTLLRKLRNVDMHLQHNKITNLKIAAQHINGLLLGPGEIFSFWKLIGRPTKRRGYKTGMVLHNGLVKSGTGGGLCQVSNLIYWATLHTPLQVVERWRHSYDVFPDANRTLPFGSGATCAYPNIDLQIVNPTSATFQLKINLTKDQLIGQWRSNTPSNFNYEVYEKSHHINHEWWGGYTRHNSIFRKITDPQNKLIKDELITENHAIMMYEPFIETAKP